MGLEDLDIRDQLHFWKHEAESARVILAAEHAMYGEAEAEFLVGVRCATCGGVKTLYVGTDLETAVAVKQHYMEVRFVHDGQIQPNDIKILRRAVMPWLEVGEDGVVL
jgi:hypothetical protein